MKAGHDLDVLIAEKVMGYHRPTNNPTSLFLYDEHGEYAWDPEDGPHYSVNIADAWLVVEKMREDRWRFVIAGVPEGIAASFRRGNSFQGEEPYQESAALAICVAALKAKGTAVAETQKND